MQTFVLAEASGTTSGDHLQAIDHYQGNFRPVKTLIDQLPTNTDTYIITDNYGLLRGTDIIENVSNEDHDQALTDATNALLDQLSDAEVVIILTTSETFRTVVADNWNTIVDTANPDSIWCLSSSQSVLNQCDLDSLRDKIQTLHTYERQGVAPIDNDTRNALIQTIETSIQ
jgi:hypothetical protein